MVSDFKKKQKRGLSKQVPLAVGLGIILLLSVFLIAANITMYQKKKELAAQVQTLENKIQDIKNKNNDLKQGIAQSGNDSYIEKVAREELDLQKPGEKVVSFIMPQAPPSNTSGDKNNLLQNWLGWLGNMLHFTK